MRRRSGLLVVCAVVVGSALDTTVSGDAQSAAPFDRADQTASELFQRESRKDPYKHLFQVPPVRGDEPNASSERVERSSPKPYVVCGTLIIPADGSIDPGIRVALPNQGAKHAIRAIEPPLCRAK